MTWTLADLVRDPALAGRPAFASAARSATFGELDERSSRLARALEVAPGDRVAVLSKNRVEYLETVFACGKAGATAVALNWRLAPAELSAILDDARPAVVVVDELHADRLPAEPGSRVVTLGDPYERLLAVADATDPRVAAEPDAVAVVLYSSGTTGLPKGIQLSNANLAYLPVMARELFRMTPDSVHLVASPLFHIGGLGTGLTTTSLGGRSVLLSDATPEDVLSTVERERVTHAFFVPAVIQRLVDLAEERGSDLSSLQVIAYGAAPMSETLLRRALEVLGCGFVGCYGMTETAGTVTALPPELHVADGPQSRLLRSIGQPLPWHEVRVVDPATGTETAAGQPGEIWVRSGAVMKGYHGQPEATALAVADGWLRTGDGAHRDHDGFLFLRDRLKDMIISGGENVYPAEVENVLEAHAAVAEVAVIGVPSQRWGETVKALVVLRPGPAATAEELIAFTRERLAHYKCPTSVDLVESLPRTATGKVQKSSLRASYAEPPS